MVIISGKKLKELRKAKGKTLEEIALLTNSSVSSVRRWEEKDSLSDIDTVYRLKNFYGVSVEELFLDEEETERRVEKKVSFKELDRTDALLLVGMAISALMQIALFTYAWCDRMPEDYYYRVWAWYFISDSTPYMVIFRVFVLVFLVLFIVCLAKYIQRGKEKKK